MAQFIVSMPVMRISKSPNFSYVGSIVNNKESFKLGWPTVLWSSSKWVWCAYLCKWTVGYGTRIFYSNFEGCVNAFAGSWVIARMTFSDKGLLSVTKFNSVTSLVQTLEFAWLLGWGWLEGIRFICYGRGTSKPTMWTCGGKKYEKPS